MKYRNSLILAASFCLILILIAGSLIMSKTGKDEDPYIKKRQQMVRYQLESRDITDKRVLEVMGTVPRHLFVRPEHKRWAYSDFALPIEEGQTISQPYIVALMTQILDVKPGDKILEIGTGSGYQAAVLAHLTDEIYSIEIKKNLARSAANRLNKLGYDNVKVKCADGYFGWEEYAPFDGIIVTCAANHMPSFLLDQLKEGGRLVIPMGSTKIFQSLTLITIKDGLPVVDHFSDVRFVPMTGEMQKRKKK